MEKDRGKFKQWIKDPARYPRLKLAVKFGWCTERPFSDRVRLDTEWLRKVDARLRVEQPV